VNSLADTFYQVCHDKFHFLVTEVACRSVVKKERSGVCRVIYRNGTTAVEIGFEWREQYIYVELYRLVDGKMKENPIMIREDSDLTVFNLDDLLAIRAPKLECRSNSPGRPLSNTDIEQILTDRALALHKYGRDVLQGDFRVFRQLERVVKSRMSASQLSQRTAVHTAKGTLASRVSGRGAERENLRLLLLAYGLEHAYRVASVDEISRAVPHARRDEVREALERLASEGLVTRFSGRYCFNKPIPAEIRYNIDRLGPPRRTIRKRAN